ANVPVGVAARTDDGEARRQVTAPQQSRVVYVPVLQTDIATKDVHQPVAPPPPPAPGPVLLRGAVPGGTPTPVRPRVAPAGDDRRPRRARGLPHLRPPRNADPDPKLRRGAAGVSE